MQWIRKNQKKLLAVFGVLLMIAFIAVPGARSGGFWTGNEKTGIFVGDEAVRMSELRGAMTDWNVLTQRERIIKTVPGFMGQPQQMWVSLAEELLADRLAPALGQSGALEAARFILKDIDGTHYMLLLHEARKMDVRVGRDTAETYLARVASRQSPDPDARERAMLNWLTVLDAFDRVSAGVKVTPAAATHLVAQSEEKISTKLVEFKASEFKDQVAQPTQQQLQDFFNKYRNEDADTNPDGYGYRFPNRVKIDYVIIPRNNLKEKVTDEDTYKHWKDNQEQYPVTQPASTQPASTQPATAPAIAQPTTRPWREVKDQIKDQVAAQLAQQMTKAVQQLFAVDWPAYRQAIRSAATTQPVVPPSSLGVPFSTYLYLQRLQTKVQQLPQSRQVLPELRSHDEYMTQEDLAALPGIGKAFTNAGGRIEDFAAFILQRAEPFMTEAQLKQARENNIPTLALYQPSSPFFSPTDGNYYIVRITAAQPAHAPSSLAEVESKVREDWKTAQALEKAREAARALAAKAKTDGIDAAAKAANNKPVISTGMFPSDGNFPIENYDLPEKARGAFVKGAFDLVQQRIKTGQEHPIDVISVPNAALCVVARLEAFTPAVKDDFFAQRVALARRELESRHAAWMIRDWFAPQSIESRLAYRAEQSQRREQSSPTQAPPPPLF